MTYIYLGIIVLIILCFKTLSLWITGNEAIEYVYKQRNWKELRERFLITSLSRYTKLLFNPFKWTFNQYFKGLKK